jgi:iron-sulfur cluster assembly accessory protein
MKFGDINVLLDPISAMHLEGTTIDYDTSLMGSGFKFNNPNAKKTCGCGSSFG